jgi:predicted deacylase
VTRRRLSGALFATAAALSLTGSATAQPNISMAAVPARATSAKAHWILLGRSEQGRAILAVRVGNPKGPRVLVVGCIHGNETAGIPIARALEHVST